MKQFSIDILGGPLRKFREPLTAGAMWLDDAATYEDRKKTSLASTLAATRDGGGVWIPPYLSVNFEGCAFDMIIPVTPEMRYSCLIVLPSFWNGWIQGVGWTDASNSGSIPYRADVAMSATATRTTPVFSDTGPHYYPEPGTPFTKENVLSRIDLRLTFDEAHKVTAISGYLYLDQYGRTLRESHNPWYSGWDSGAGHVHPPAVTFSVGDTIPFSGSGNGLPIACSSTFLGSGVITIKETGT